MVAVPGCEHAGLESSARHSPGTTLSLRITLTPSAVVSQLSCHLSWSRSVPSIRGALTAPRTDSVRDRVASLSRCPASSFSTLSHSRPASSWQQSWLKDALGHYSSQDPQPNTPSFGHVVGAPLLSKCLLPQQWPAPFSRHSFGNN